MVGVHKAFTEGCCLIRDSKCPRSPSFPSPAWEEGKGEGGEGGQGEVKERVKEGGKEGTKERVGGGGGKEGKRGGFFRRSESSAAFEGGSTTLGGGRKRKGGRRMGTVGSTTVGGGVGFDGKKRIGTQVRRTRREDKTMRSGYVDLRFIYFCYAFVGVFVLIHFPSLFLFLSPPPKK